MEKYITAQEAVRATQEIDPVDVQINWMMKGVQICLKEALSKKGRRAELKVDYKVSDHAVYRVKHAWKKLGYRILVDRHYGAIGEGYLRPSYVTITLFW